MLFQELALLPSPVMVLISALMATIEIETGTF
jgi:hypothetical protein